MVRINVGLYASLLVLRSALPVLGQSAATTTSMTVPQLVNFNGALADVRGEPLTGAVGVTFFLYKEPQGGAPVWMETQNVQADGTGHYTAALGSSTNQGLPANIFTSGEARWLGVQAQGQAEQPRILLMSVPYALKAADAQTVGGIPASAFLLATPRSAASGGLGGTGTSGPRTANISAEFGDRGLGAGNAGLDRSDLPERRFRPRVPDDPPVAMVNATPSTRSNLRGDPPTHRRRAIRHGGRRPHCRGVCADLEGWPRSLVGELLAG
jgi:hypothetical protein